MIQHRAVDVGVRELSGSGLPQVGMAVGILRRSLPVYVSRYYALVVVDIENWGGQPGAAQARMQAALRLILERAMVSVGIGSAGVRSTSRGDGMIIALSTEVSKELVTVPLVKALNRELRIYDDECPPDEVMRLRVALHAGDVHDGGTEWAGEAVVTACRLVDSDVLHRVLTAADTAVLAVIVSGSWYDAVLRAGWAVSTGYDHVRPAVKDYAGDAWIRVPGKARPPGLLPSDTASEPPPPPSAAGVGAARSISFTNNGTHVGDNVAGNKNTGRADGVTFR